MSNLDNWQETYTIFCSFFSGVGISIHSFHIIIKQSPLALSMPFMWLDCDAMRVYLTNHFHENWRFLLGPFSYKIYTKIAPTGEGFACLRYNKNLAAPRGWMWSWHVEKKENTQVHDSYGAKYPSKIHGDLKFDSCRWRLLFDFFWFIFLKNY